MSLLLKHPVLARLDCETCQTHQVNYDWSTHEGDGSIVLMANGTLPVLRVVPPPCEKCPKESPAKAREYELSRDNCDLVDFYWTVKATCGACLTDNMRTDTLLTQRLAIVEQILGQRDHG